MNIERTALLPTVEKMKQSGFDYLVKITAVDYVKKINIVYIFRSIEHNKDEILEVEIDPSDAWIESIMKFYLGADWYERELQEMFGVKVKGRRAKRLLLEKWDGKGFPLRKNFGWNKPYDKE